MKENLEESCKRTIRKTIPVQRKEFILEYLKTHGPTKVNTPELYNMLGISKKVLEDSLKYLELVENLLLKEKVGRANYWRLKDDKELISEKLSQKDLTSLTYALELKKEHFDTSTFKAIEKVFQTNQKYMEGHLSLYEEFQDSKISEFYDDLVDAIKNHKYLRLEFSYDQIGIYNNVKPVKIVFIDNNWYIAFEYTNKEKTDFVFRRLAFMKDLQELKYFKYSDKDTFQTKELQKYMEFIQNIQNSMSLYGVKPQTATLKASPSIAKYFDKNMKKFLSSQKFVKKEDDGSIIFTVEYTHDLEILPFVQKWLPDLIVLEPEDLRDRYKAKLQRILHLMTT